MTKVIAHPDSPSLAKVLARAAQLHRGLEELGLSDMAYQKAIDDLDIRRQLVMAWESLANPAAVGASSTSCTLAEAAQIMGSNFHGPQDANKYFGIRMGQKVFKSVPFGADELKVVANTHVLVAAPSMSIMDIHGKAPEAFYFKSDPWYGLEEQKFAGLKVKPGWYLVRKEAVPDRASSAWTHQQRMVKLPDFVPEANLAVYAYVVHYLATGDRLFRTLYVRVDSVTAVDRRVRLGGYVGGLNVSSWHDDAGSSVGVASARNSS